MDWVQTLSIIATIIASAYYVHREVQADIRHARDEIKTQSARSDKLYEIWCETQKEIKQLYIELLKERK